MPRFRKLPIQVEAEQFVLDDAGYNNPFGAVKFQPPRDASPGLHLFLHGQTYIETLHGPVVIKPGDWIVRGDRDVYPVNETLFAQLFERVEDAG